MFVGHFAVAFLLKSLYPRVPSFPIFYGVGVLDVLNGIFNAAGINEIYPDPDAGPYLFFRMPFAGYDHSLTAALFISLIWGGIFSFGGRETGIVSAIAVFSHWITDWPVHNDLAVTPHSKHMLGLGLWEKYGSISWAGEGVFAAAVLAYSWLLLSRHGVSLKWPAIILLVLFFQVSPSLSPMLIVSQMEEPQRHLVQGIMTTMSFLLPAVVFTALFDKFDREVTDAQPKKKQ